MSAMRCADAALVSESRPATHTQVVVAALDYPVAFTRDAFAEDNPVLADVIARREPHRRHRVFAVIDDGLLAASPELADRLERYAGAHASRLALTGAPLLVPGGELAKTDRTVLEGVLAEMHGAALDRHSVVLAIGGGAVLDLVGYAAAITHRGVRVVRVPSTVLAQADSGVGVKNGVNAFGKKNYLGTFAVPFAVVVDDALLRTLSPRDRAAGMSEAVKVALVRDADFFGWIARTTPRLSCGDAAALERLVSRSAELHLEHIASGGDPFELGSARPLDYGHWAAHKLESLTAHRLRHGEAVAIGIAIDTLYARLAGLCGDTLVDAVLRTLRDLDLPRWDAALTLRSADGRLAVLEGLREFREHLGGDLSITMLRDAAVPTELHAIDEGLVEQAITHLESGRCG